MITIVLHNWNRHELLYKSLESFTKSKYKDFNVLVVDNNSNTPVVIPDLPFEVFLLEMKTHLKSTSFIAAHNYGFYYALKFINPDIIIMSHSEMYHVGDIIGYVKENLNESNYISFGCYSQGKDETIGSVINAKGASFNGESAWYNHPVYRPVGYHFCSAITAKNMIKLNGFDERLKDGIAYDDDFYLHQVNNLGLKIVITSTPYVIHQWHEQTQWGGESNENLYNELVQSKDYKAVHLITPDL